MNWRPSLKEMATTTSLNHRNRLTTLTKALLPMDWKRKLLTSYPYTARSVTLRNTKKSSIRTWILIGRRKKQRLESNTSQFNLLTIIRNILIPQRKLDRKALTPSPPWEQNSLKKSCNQVRHLKFLKRTPWTTRRRKYRNAKTR